METPARPNRFEQYPKTVLTLILVPLILILDLGLTGAYHLFKYGTIHKEADRRALRERSAVFHHTFKAYGHHSTQKWGKVSHPISTNSLGFKDQVTREVPLQSSSYRLLLIGDSFTEGIGFPYEKTFVGLVDEALKDHNVEVLNAAVASYSPAIYLKKVEYLLKTVGLKFEHLIVFLDISDIDDEMTNYRIREGRVVWVGEKDWGIRDFVFEYTGLVKNIWIVIEKIQESLSRDPERLRSQEDKKYGTNRYRSLWTIKEEVFTEYGRGGVQRAIEHMDTLYELLQEHDIGMTVAVYPWPDQIIHHDLNSRQVKIWRQWASRHSVTFLNFFPYFIQPDSDPKSFLSEYFIEGDVHWNEKGHQLMAHALMEQLQEKNPSLFTNK
jgi:lysophospholipase L1-like esterase